MKSSTSEFLVIFLDFIVAGVFVLLIYFVIKHIFNLLFNDIGNNDDNNYF